MDNAALIADIAAYIKACGISESTFGRRALKDWAFVRDIRGTRRVWPTTEARVRKYMADHPAPDAATCTAIAAE